MSFLLMYWIIGWKGWIKLISDKTQILFSSLTVQLFFKEKLLSTKDSYLVIIASKLLIVVIDLHTRTSPRTANHDFSLKFCHSEKENKSIINDTIYYLKYLALKSNIEQKLINMNLTLLMSHYWVYYMPTNIIVSTQQTYYS